MRIIYSAFFYLLSPLLWLRLLYRGLKNPAYLSRLPERMGFTTVSVQQPLVWVHSVSVGEVRAAAPLIDALTRLYPDLHFLVTTMTPTGGQQARQTFGTDVQHCYVPYDYPGSVKRFLDRVQPRLLIVMETEIWPNILHHTEKRGIPSIYANVRLSERSLRGYQKFRRLICPTVQKISCLAVQNANDANRLRKLGAAENRINITGSIKFEISVPASIGEVAESARLQWGRNRLVWIAGSTREGEDELILGVYDQLKREFPDLLLVLVPRHPERFNSVHRMCQRAGYQVIRRSEQVEPLSSQTEVFLGDTMGELTIFYAAADVAFVGGSLVPTGGHNVLEPCSLGTPAIYGPHMFNFVEIAQITRQRNAGIQVNNTRELKSALQDLLAHPELRHQMGEAGKLMVQENRGALRQTLELVKPFVESLDYSNQSL